MTSDILTYLISVSIATTGLYGLYAVILRKQTHFQLNRLYLLAILIVSLLIPFLEIGTETAAIATPIEHNTEYRVIPNIAAPIYHQLNNLEQYNYSPMPAKVSPLVVTLGDILLLLYLTISLVFLLRLFTKIRRIHSIIKQSKDGRIKGSKALLHPQMPVSSFLYYIFWKKENHPLDHLILAHEHAHIKQFHTLDIIFIEALSTVFWFNPVLTHIRKELQLIHEYLADEAVLNRHQNKQQYAELLCYQVNTPKPYLVQTFQSFVPSRLKMMYRRRSSNKSYFHYILFVPIVAGLVALLSKADAQNMISAVAQSVVKIQDQNIVSITMPVTPFPAQTKNLEWGKLTIPFQANTGRIPSLRTSLQLQLQDLKALSKEVLYLQEEDTRNALTIVGADRFDPDDQRKPNVFQTSQTKKELTIPELLSKSGPIADHTLFRISLKSDAAFVILDLTVLNASKSNNYLVFEHQQYFQTLFNHGPSYPNFIDRANLVTTEELGNLLKSSNIYSFTEGVQQNLKSFELFYLQDLRKALNPSALISLLDQSIALDKSKLISDLESSKNLTNPIAFLHHNDRGIPYLAVFTTQLPLALQYQEYQELNRYESNDYTLLLRVNQELTFSWGPVTYKSPLRNQLFQYSSFAPPPIFDTSIRAQENSSELDKTKQMLRATPRLIVDDQVVNNFEISFVFIDHKGVRIDCHLNFENGKCTSGEEDRDKVIQKLKVNDFIHHLSIVTDNESLVLQESIKISTKEEIENILESNRGFLPPNVQSKDQKKQ